MPGDLIRNMHSWKNHNWRNDEFSNEIQNKKVFSCFFVCRGLWDFGFLNFKFFELRILLGLFHKLINSVLALEFSGDFQINNYNADDWNRSDQAYLHQKQVKEFAFQRNFITHRFHGYIIGFTARNRPRLIATEA